jgi:hypothetical protein
LQPWLQWLLLQPLSLQKLLHSLTLLLHLLQQPQLLPAHLLLLLQPLLLEWLQYLLLLLQSLLQPLYQLRPLLQLLLQFCLRLPYLQLL